MDPASITEVGRIGERWLITLAGALLIFLGYKLFLAGVGGAAKIRIKAQGQTWQLENAAPGIVFALFGAVLLIRAIAAPMEISRGKDSTTTKYSDPPVAIKEGITMSIRDAQDLFRSVYAVLENSSDAKTALRRTYTSVYTNNRLILGQEFAPDRLPKE